jgi:hypothetical protein
MRGNASRRLVAAIAGGEAWFMARAWLCAPLVELALAGLGLEAMVKGITRVPRLRPPWRKPVSIEAGERATARAYRFHPWFRGACLSRSLAQLLGHRLDGVPACLVIGVKRPLDHGVPLEAHAWVERPETDTASSDFAPIFRVETP